jgi:hypothetical protein
MFPSPGILQRYVKFESHTIIKLEKLFGVGSFGGSIDHLPHCHAILIIFSNELGFPPMV